MMGPRNKRRQTPVYRPLPPKTQRPPAGQMTPEEMRHWIQQTCAQLTRKMQRERAYLDRRAARGTYTPTDEAYEADQVLEADILAFFEETEQRLNEEGF